MSHEAEGTIILIKPTQQVNEKFRKREFVVEIAENPDYPQQVMFEMVQDRCSALDSYQQGGGVRVTFDLRGRKWTNQQGEDRYFNTLQCWKIEPLHSMQTTAPAGAPTGNTETDKIPF